VRRAGGQVRITARLSRAATGEQLWSESYTRELKDVFAVQSELAETIVGQLRGQLGGAAAKAEIQAQVQEAARGGTKNPDAHELYLQGKYFLDRGNYGDAMRAIGLLQRAVERDPSFALAWAALSGAGWFRGSYGNDRRDFDDGYDLARRAAERTIALEPELAAGYVALFDLQSSVDFDWKGARESLRRAEALAPGDAAVVFRAAQLAYGFGQEELAIGLIKQAAALDPINPQIYTSKGYISLAARRFAEAEAAFRQLVDMTPASPWGHAGIALALVGQGKFDRAEAEARQEPVEWSRLYALSLAQWGRKQPSEADETLAQLVKGAADIAAYQIATIHAYRGEPDAAFEWLERAYRQHDPGLSLSMPDFLLESLHADPRWETFQRKLGLANDRL
ncbi:MAG TPA: tetratricopeptide repeat protein, partial [Opitutus sp.]|nr:tetratricopeptide repeat protein [Opitutus sp.]